AGLILDHNRIACAGAGGCVGIQIMDGMSAQLSGNSVFTTTPSLAYVLDSDQIIWGAKNSYPSSQGDIDPVSAASNMLIPDDPHTIVVSGASTVNQISTYDQARVGAGVAYVTVTNGGSGFSSGATTTFTGGSCSTPPAAIAYRNGAGVISGVRMSNY